MAKPQKKKTAKTKSSAWSEVGTLEDWKNWFTGEKIRFFIGLIVLVVAVFFFLSLISNLYTGAQDQAGIEHKALDAAANYGGKLGAYVSYYFMNECFGIFALFIPVFLLQLSMKIMAVYRVRLWKWFLNFSIVMIWGSVFASALRPSLPKSFLNFFSFELGGNHGVYVNEVLNQNVGVVGTFILLIAVAICYFVYLSSETITIVGKLLNPTRSLPNLRERIAERVAIEEAQEAGDKAFETVEDDVEAQEEEELDETDVVEEELEDEELEDNGIELSLSPSVSKATKVADDVDFVVEGSAEEAVVENETPLPASATDGVGQEGPNLEPYDPRKSLENYKFPTLDLLKKFPDDAPAIDMVEQNANKDRIIEILNNFGVGISSIKATVGPTITLYEITPAQGVRISKIRGLEDDIALSLSALGIRIIAPIPGKGTVGIEVPNKNPRIVSMESILNSKRFQETTYDLPIAIGKTITNDVFMVDLAKMPHLLVAGATGQGKSVGLNAIITSLLYKKHPTELKFVMVDPKKVEFSIYAPLEKYFITKLPEEKDAIITDVSRVVKTLKSLCALMDHRYDLLKKARVRTLKEYNEKFKARQLNPNEGHEFMPFVVIIIDEFGDLIMTAGKEVELPIARIAQLARAVGMHMVIATQRPTTNIITGTIKANFPARMAFKVSAQIDSRTILDGAGANQLIGRGDLLFLSGMTGAEPVRVQCAFVDTPEVERINRFIEEQPGWLAPYELPEVLDTDSEGGGSGELDTSVLDSMFEDAARLIVMHQQGSTSLIQRKFAIGYARAGRLMDQLEKAGVVGPTQGSKPREVLVADENTLDLLLSNLRA